MTVVAAKPKKCVKCKCNIAHYKLSYDDPETRRVVKLELCRLCQMMMVNTIERCQGLGQEVEGDE